MNKSLWLACLAAVTIVAGTAAVLVRVAPWGLPIPAAAPAAKVIDQGGFAFPLSAGLGNTNQGMTLRDYFAAQAITGREGSGIPNAVARRAYELADAMIEARKRQP